MEEKRLEHPEERQDEKQEKKKQYPVTRRDFYGCVIILLIAVFLQGMQTRALIRREAQNMNNRCQNIESQMWNSISNIQDGIASSLAEADNPLQESSVEIVAANLKEKKVTLRMTAMPKEWKTGDTSLQFYLSCDGGEKIAVDAGGQVQTIALRRKRKYPSARLRQLRQSCKEGIRNTPSIWAKRV